MWYYIPAPYNVPGRWSILPWESRSQPDGSQEPNAAVFLNNGLGGLKFNLNVYDGSQPASSYPGYPASSKVAVPIGRWFQIEGFMHRAQDNSGHLTIWVDGQQLWDVRGVRTSFGLYERRWTVNSYTDDINNNKPITIYIDDAAISSTRIRP